MQSSADERIQRVEEILHAVQSAWRQAAVGNERFWKNGEQEQEVGPVLALLDLALNFGPHALSQDDAERAVDFIGRYNGTLWPGGLDPYDWLHNTDEGKALLRVAEEGPNDLDDVAPDLADVLEDRGLRDVFEAFTNLRCVTDVAPVVVFCGRHGAEILDDGAYLRSDWRVTAARTFAAATGTPLPPAAPAAALRPAQDAA